MMLLGGDIGGTHTRLALFDAVHRSRGDHERTFLNKHYTSLAEIVHEYLQTIASPIHKACFGLAGPIHQGTCHITNLPWSLNAKELAQQLHLEKVYFLNDLQANAYGIRALQKKELFLLQKGFSQPGNAALISAGTGLGEAGLYWDGTHHHPFACEGGHADFAPRTPEECELLFFLQKVSPHVSYERILSGPGLYAIYQFLTTVQHEAVDPWVWHELQTKDPGPVISEWGMTHRDPACVRTLQWFLSIYGAEAGNLALKMLSLGGLYIGGGITPHLLPLLKESRFLQSFAEKGRFQSLLQSIPVWVILNDQTALLGTAEYAREQP